MLADQQVLTNNGSVRTQDTLWWAYQERWNIGSNGKSETEKSVLAARLDINDDDVFTDSKIKISGRQSFRCIMVIMYVFQAPYDQEVSSVFNRLIIIIIMIIIIIIINMSMKVTVIPILLGALWTIPKGLVKGVEGLEIKGQGETMQATLLLRSVGILRRVLETW